MEIHIGKKKHKPICQKKNLSNQIIKIQKTKDKRQINMGKMYG